MQIHGITEITLPNLIEDGQIYLIHPQVVSSEVTMVLSSPKELLKLVYTWSSLESLLCQYLC
jgi:hypothetical protein